MFFMRIRRLGRPLFFRRFTLLRRWTLRRALLIGLPVAAGLCLIASPLMAADATSRPAAALRADRADRPDRANRPDRAKDGQLLQQLRQAVQSLDLTQDQKSQLRDIFQQTAGDIRSIRQGTSTTQPAEKRAAIGDRLDQARQQIQQILTPAQLEKLRPQLQAIRDELKQHRQELAAHLTQRIDAALAQLNLSADQQQQITALREDLKAKIQAVKANPDDAAAKEALKTAVQDAREKFQQILTPEQKQQLKEMVRPEESPSTTPAPASPKGN